MNPFISINSHLDEEERWDNICECAEEHGVNEQVAERYLEMKSQEDEYSFGDADRYLESHKELNFDKD